MISHCNNKGYASGFEYFYNLFPTLFVWFFGDYITCKYSYIGLFSL